MIALQSVLACPVCFGQSDSPMAWAMNTGILFMLVIIVGVLAASRASSCISCGGRASRRIWVRRKRDRLISPAPSGRNRGWGTP